MSSMLKKTGGLSFKPKAARRPGTGPSKPPATTTTEPLSETSTSTPATSDSSTPVAVVISIETAGEQEKSPTPTARLPKPSTLKTPSTRADSSAVQVEPAVLSPSPPSSPVIQNQPPLPSDESTRDQRPTSEPQVPAANSSKRDALRTHNVETENESLATSGTSSPASAAQSAPAPEASSAAEEAASEPPTEPSSPAPVSSASSATSHSGETATPEPTASKEPVSQRRKSTVLDDRTDADNSSEPPKKRPRKPLVSRRPVETSNRVIIENKKPVKRRARDPTPGNAEELTVDHTKMTVGELTKDLGIGKRFKHADEIEQRAREARIKNRQKRLDREKQRLGLLPPEDEDSPDTNTERNGTQGAAIAQIGASMEAGAGQGVGYDVVDGQIVVHAASLVVDRHNRDMSNLEEVEENDFTNLVTSASFAKRVQAPGNWSPEDTEKFYRLLGMFGTDFETISRLFPGKNRRAVKLKFNKEERLHPSRVNAAMMVRGQKKVNIDIEEYKASQRQWQAKDKILAEHAKLTQEHEREVARLREERRAAGLIDDDDDEKCTPVNGSKNANADTSNRDTNGQMSEEFEVIEEDADALGPG
ncbi:hypothetical protein GGS21DRAFT_544714 [Xylaria nigripes]|nr:hypothetical protein GGS21DRAFT_544714 [Xylaria nigripes]